MNYLKVAGLGLVIWAIMFVFVFVFLSLYNQYDAFKIVAIVFAGILSLLIAYYYVKSKKVTDALIVGSTWVIVGLLLDYFITRTQFNSQILTSPFVWAGYFMIFIAPLLYLTVKEN